MKPFDNDLSPFKRLPVLIALGLVFFSSFLLLVLDGHQVRITHAFAHDEKQHTQVILNQLHDITTQVQQIALSPSVGQLKTALLAINQNVAVIKKSALAEQHELTQLASQISALRTDFNSQLHDLRSAVVNGDAKQYLDANTLPFQVLSVDVIAQQPFVSIAYQQHMTALQRGDSLAGWQITAIDYGKAEVEFKNANDQYIKVGLAG